MREASSVKWIMKVKRQASSAECGFFCVSFVLYVEARAASVRVGGWVTRRRGWLHEWAGRGSDIKWKWGRCVHARSRKASSVEEPKPIVNSSFDLGL